MEKQADQTGNFSVARLPMFQSALVKLTATSAIQASSDNQAETWFRILSQWHGRMPGQTCISLELR